jgi:hypothetical protein
MKPTTPLHGLMAEYETAQQVLEATRLAREAGYRDMDAYTPYTVEGLSSELGLPRTRVPWRGRWIFHAVLLDGDRLSAQRRRPTRK